MGIQGAAVFIVLVLAVAVGAFWAASNLATPRTLDTVADPVERRSTWAAENASPAIDPLANVTWLPYDETFVLSVQEAWAPFPPPMVSPRYRTYGGCVEVRDRDVVAMRNGTVTATWGANPALTPMSLQVEHDLPSGGGAVLHSSPGGSSPQVITFEELRSWSERTTVSGFQFGVRGNATQGASVVEVELRLVFEYAGTQPLPVDHGHPTVEWVPQGDGNGGCVF